MRLTSALFVAAHIRRCYSEGASAVVIRRGADEAGAIFVMVDRLDDTIDLYGPAPQTAFLEPGRPNERLFQRLTDRSRPDEVNRRLEREASFDPDIWVVAIEDREGRSFLDVAPA
jgi:hypothetical protein